MTEREWHGDDVTAMLTFLGGRISRRKLRLFGVACCQTIWPILIDNRSRQAVRVAARLADGEADEWERRKAYAAARQAYIDADDPSGTGNTGVTAGLLAALAAASTLPHFRTASDVAQVAQMAARARALMETRHGKPPPCGSPTERLRQAALLRDIAGPMPTPGMRPGWLSPTVRAIAEGAYLARDWQALPVLADALEDEGCADEAILKHCRGATAHVRGCWVIDRILGKE